MRKLLVGTALACLLMAADAMADGHVTDPCGVSAIGTLPDAYPEPTVPWLDLCDTDIAGFQTSAGRGIKATIHVAGDTDLRQSSASYSVLLEFGNCFYQLNYYDLGLDTSGHGTRIQGECNQGPAEPCDYVPPAVGCWQSGDSGDEFDIRNSNGLTGVVASGMTGSTITLTFDPSKLAAGSVPQTLIDELQPGATIRWAETISEVRAGAVAVTGQEGYYDLVDWGYGDGDNIPLG